MYKLQVMRRLRRKLVGKERNGSSRRKECTRPTRLASQNVKETEKKKKNLSKKKQMEGAAGSFSFYYYRFSEFNSTGKHRSLLLKGGLYHLHTFEHLLFF